MVQQDEVTDIYDARARQPSRWRRWGGYAVGILIEIAAVVSISLLALLLMYVVKVIVT